jgi:hypothetical protein
MKLVARWAQVAASEARICQERAWGEVTHNLWSLTLQSLTEGLWPQIDE